MEKSFYHLFIRFKLNEIYSYPQKFLLETWFAGEGGEVMKLQG